MILSRGAGTPSGRGSKLAELEVAATGAVISGSKTVQVDVKE